jgi:hypothetical protein
MNVTISYPVRFNQDLERQNPVVRSYMTCCAEMILETGPRPRDGPANDNRLSSGLSVGFVLYCALVAMIYATLLCIGGAGEAGKESPCP